MRELESPLSRFSQFSFVILKTTVNSILQKLAPIKKYMSRGRVVVSIATAQLHLTKPELRFCAGSNRARGVSKFRDVEEL